MISFAVIILVSAIGERDLKYSLVGGTALTILLTGTWHAFKTRLPKSEQGLQRLRWSEYLLVAASLVGLHILLIFAKITVLDDALASAARNWYTAIYQLPLHLSLFIVSFLTTSAAAKTLAKCLDENQRAAYIAPTTVASPDPMVAAIEIAIPPLTRRQEYALVIAPVLLCLLVSLASWALILGVSYRLLILFDGWLRTDLPPTAQLRLLPASIRTKAAQRKLRRPEPSTPVVESGHVFEHCLAADLPLQVLGGGDLAVRPGGPARAPSSAPVDVRPLMLFAILLIALWLIDRRRPLYGSEPDVRDPGSRTRSAAGAP